MSSGGFDRRTAGRAPTEGVGQRGRKRSENRYRHGLAQGIACCAQRRKSLREHPAASGMFHAKHLDGRGNSGCAGSELSTN